MKLLRRFRVRRRLAEYRRDLERKAGVILFLGAAAVATVAILISKGCE